MGVNRPRLPCLSLTVCVVLLVALPSAFARSLHVGLHASWPSTSCSAEAAAWVSDTVGSHAVLGFLKAFIAEREKLDSESDNTEQATLPNQCRLVRNAVDNQFGDSLMSSTLSWILTSRSYSSHIHLHYSLAKESLDAFRASSPDSQLSDVGEIFAVKMDVGGTRAQLLRDSRYFADCTNCAVVQSERSGDELPFGLSLVSEITLFPRCDSAKSLPRIFIYANVAAPGLASWLEAAEQRTKQCAESFVLRFWQAPLVESMITETKPSLQGFAVEVTLKSTEYKVVDDRVFSTPLFDDCGYGVVNCGNATTPVGDALTWPEDEGEVSRKTYTGLDVLKYVKKKSDGDLGAAIKALRNVVEDGPSITRSSEFIEISKEDSDISREMSEVAGTLREAIGEDDYLFINGRPVSISSLREDSGAFFRCLSTISSASMNLRKTSAELGALEMPRLSQPAAQHKSNLRVDLEMDKELKESLVWFNDLHKDTRYKRWASLDPQEDDDVKNFLKLIEKHKSSSPQSGGNHNQLAKVRSHHLSLVLVVDPGDMEQFGFLSVPESVVQGGIPMRAGLLLIPNGPVSSLIAASFHHFRNSNGQQLAAQFLGMIRQVVEYMGGGYQAVPLTEDIIELAFQQVSAGSGGSKYQSAKEVLETDEDVKGKLEEALRFAKNNGLVRDLAAVDGHQQHGTERKVSKLVILNGIVVKDVVSDTIPLAISEQDRIARLLKSNDFDSFAEDSAFQTWVSGDPNLIVVKGLSQDMRSGDDTSRSANANNAARISSKQLFALRNELRLIDYIEAETANHEVDGPRSLTIWLAGMDREGEGFKRADALLQEVASSPFAARTNARFAVLDAGLKLNEELSVCRSESKCFADTVFVVDGRILPATNVKTVDDLKVEIASEFHEAKEESKFSDTGKHETTSAFGDLLLLTKIVTEDISSACASSPIGRPRRSDVVTYEDVIGSLESSKASSIAFRSNGDGHGDEAAPLNVLGVVDPMDRNAYIVLAFMDAIRIAYRADDLSMRLAVAPSSRNLKKHFDLPSTYYQFLMRPHSKLDDSEGGQMSSEVVFHRLPQQRVLTVAVDPPRAWFVSSFATNYDMDNVILNSLPSGTTELHAEYELQNLIVEGSCIDENDAPPQGLKLILENESGASVDTLVMANLGYFQLKVPAPGRWNLLLAGGPSSRIFALKSMDMYRDGVKTTYKVDSLGRAPILVESLSGAGGILLHVTRRPGMEGASLLGAAEEKGGDSQGGGVIGSLTSRIRNLIESSSDKLAHHSVTERSSSRANTINIFSVASGHLYERFLKIMMTSVTKHASRPVKFWLLENYLSPSFKKMLPHFAKKLGCEVGMVTYKWPGWLRAQTEKQRIIWAYKILFLDVLFPLDVNRIIFVDSDQVVRGDLAELMDIDLQGAPYGYVPFCDSRKEVEGYRFWKQGFWKDTLKGAKYRISALYVVDLARFRETAAGDTLRFIYQSLSADPNSLSNLDQDLPNYASVAAIGGAKSVPIFDLPQEWLWCESWCDDESKESAKTIDLCNNPMTKEPKLESARRIISEWTDYDDAASLLTEQIYKDLVGGTVAPNETRTSLGGPKEDLVEPKLHAPPAAVDVDEDRKSEL